MTHRRCILFLCTGNSCRSQMAEGFLRTFCGDRIEALTAGCRDRRLFFGGRKLPGLSRSSRTLALAV